MAETIKLGFDPKQLLASLNQASEAVKNLAQDTENALGEQAVRGTRKFTEEAQNSSKQVKSLFGDLGKTIKDNLRTAFDATGIMAGTRVFQELATGVRQVFEMERAFDRLNTRLMLTGRTFDHFRTQVGEAVASRGANLQDILPGVETAAARGGIRDPKQLGQISDVLARANRINPNESSDQLASTIVDIIKQEGKAVNAENFQRTADAIEGTRVSGNFKTATEAGQAISNISSFAEPFHLDTRTRGGLAAVASNAGPGGNELLHSLFQSASSPGNEQALNEMLGRRVFTTDRTGGRHFDPQAFSQVDTKRLGQYSQSIMAQQTGLGDISGTELSHVVNEFKSGMGNLDRVVNGANETTVQFEQATNNLAERFQRFRTSVIQGGAEIGGGLSQAANDILNGNFKQAGQHLGDAATGAYEHRGAIAGAGAASLAGAYLMGGGLNRILGRSGAGAMGSRVSGLAQGLTGGALAQSLGVQQVYVVNASEIATRANEADALANAAGAAGGTGGSGFLGKAGRVLGAVSGVAAAGQVGWDIGSAINNTSAGQWFSDKASGVLNTLINGSDDMLMRQGAAQVQSGIDESRLRRAVQQGASEADLRVVRPLTNPSTVQPKEASM